MSRDPMRGASLTDAQAIGADTSGGENLCPARGATIIMLAAIYRLAPNR